MMMTITRISATSSTHVVAHARIRVRLDGGARLRPAPDDRPDAPLLDRRAASTRHARPPA